MKSTHYHRNPGLKVPRKLPAKLRQDVNSFIESESVDREARAIELANLYGISVYETLRELEKKSKTLA